MPSQHQPPPPGVVAQAVRAAAESTCLSRRGAVVFTVAVADYVYEVKGTGHNFRPDGECTRDEACKKTCYYTACHAEQVALISAEFQNIKLDKEVLYCLHIKVDDQGKMVFSGPPACAQCAKLLLMQDYDGVYLYHETGWTLYDMQEFHELSLRNDRHIPRECAHA